MPSPLRNQIGAHQKFNGSFVSISRKSVIRRRFTRSVPCYVRNAALHRAAAARLADLAAVADVRTILELGCGPGILTRALIARFPHASLLATDVVPEALAACEAEVRTHKSVRFAIVDADALDLGARFDLIASSMVLHWLDDAPQSLARQRAFLTPGGRVAFSTIGHENFCEWQSALSEVGVASGLTMLQDVPGLVFEERISIDYGSAQGFLRMLKETGADQPRRGYTPLSPRELKEVCRIYNARFGGRATWHVVYGLLDAAD